MVPWAVVNSLALPFGLWLFRSAPAYYRSFQASFHARKDSIRNTPREAARALNLLFFAILTSLLCALPYFTPSNVFSETSASLQTPTELIFNRLASIRKLSDLEFALKTKLTAKTARLAYLAFGPETVAYCEFCSPSTPNTYLYYLLPALVASHLLHLAVLGLSTSRLFGGQDGARWRSYAVTVGLIIGIMDIYWHITYDLNKNATSIGSSTLDAFHWHMRQLRYLSFMLTDVALAGVIWLSSTNRFFIQPVTTALRLEQVRAALDDSTFRSWATGNIRNTVVRDPELRQKMSGYWTEESEVFEDREVVNALNSALQRIDMRALSQVAEQKSVDVLRSLGG